MEIIKEQRIVGRRERADFPEFGIESVDLKIDTGAYGSAIHCSLIELDDKDTLCVVFLEEGDSGYTGEVQKFSEFELRKVKSSNGQTEERFTIHTFVMLGSKKFKIRVSLTDRSAMRIPVLIGRRFLRRNRFVVDPRLVHSIDKY